MPRPARVDAEPLLLRDGSRIDPISAGVHPRVTANEAWQQQVTTPVATYRVLLGYYTDRPDVQGAPGQPLRSHVQHVAAWVVLAHHAPLFPDPLPSLPNASTAPRCAFGDTIDVIDATTGRDLGGGTL